MSLVREAVENSHHLAEDVSLLTLIKALIWFTQEYHRQNKSVGKKAPCSEFESKLATVSQELRFNVKLLVEEGVLSAVKAVLKLTGKTELQVMATRLLWCLAHDTSIRPQIWSDSELVGVVEDLERQHSPQLKKASHSVLWLLGLKSDGKFVIIMIGSTVFALIFVMVLFRYRVIINFIVMSN